MSVGADGRGQRPTQLSADATGSDNPLQQEMAAEGDAEQYTCISVQHALSPPDASFLISLSEIPKGSGRSDFVDALTVAVDCIYRACERLTPSGACCHTRCMLP